MKKSKKTKKVIKRKKQNKKDNLVFDFAAAFVIFLILLSLITGFIYKKFESEDNSVSTVTGTSTASMSSEYIYPTVTEADIAVQQQKIREAEEAARIAQQNYEEAVKRAEEAAQNAQNYSNQIASENYTYTSPAIDTNVEAPRSSVYAYASGGGSLLGNYYYKVSFVNRSGYVSSLSPSSLSVSANNNTIRVSNVPKSEDVNVTQRRVYRTKGDGSMVGPYYLVKTIYDNSYSSSFYDNTPDSDLYLPNW